jgi:hypothetical protein
MSLHLIHLSAVPLTPVWLPTLGTYNTYISTLLHLDAAIQRPVTLANNIASACIAPPERGPSIRRSSKHRGKNKWLVKCHSLHLNDQGPPEHAIHFQVRK